jgi:hypothetical protein
MAEKQDIREDQMNLVSGVDYVRGLIGNDSVLIALNNLFANYGIVRENKRFDAGEEKEINFKNGGIVIIRVSSYRHSIGMAVINSDLSANVLSELPNGNFGGKVEGKICIYRKEINGNLYIYNGAAIAHNINACFISVT